MSRELIAALASFAVVAAFVVFALLALAGCGGAGIIPSVDACEHAIYERHGDIARGEVSECRVRRQP